MANFRSVLIANRGEIAVRIARSVQAQGQRAIAVYSEPDLGAPHVQQCDLAVALSGASAAESYLDMDKILAAAKASGAEAIHPGYGFLSENADFAERCEAAGLVFIGPTPAAIRLMGSKRAAKDCVSAAGVPCIPGYQGADQSDGVLVAQGQAIGAPLMVKASAGGGGRGMRLVTDLAALPEAISSARQEARSAFGSDELILERAITTGRHIEVQVAADSHGNVIHLGERDCSLQRRHQKVIEEAPSPFVAEPLRAAMGEAAVSAARACDYRGVGTVEFLVAEDASFSFLEMNTRLQVEHPVTELVTGLDLVAMQLDIAQGKRLALTQSQVNLTGHAIEARLYAEDVGAGFIPQTGEILVWEPATDEGVRVDSGICSGGRVSQYYDPMLAKVIAYGSSREQARERLQRALQTTTMLGLTTNQHFLHELLADPQFVAGNATITYLDQHPELHAPDALSSDAIGLAVVALLHSQDPQPPHLRNWSNAEPMQRRRKLLLNGESLSVRVLAQNGTYQMQWDGGETRVILLTAQTGYLDVAIAGVQRRIRWVANADNPDKVFVQLGSLQLCCEDFSYQPATAPGAASSGEVQASTEGLLIEINVTEGQPVTAGQTLAVVEAMKMQHRHLAPADGVVEKIAATADTQVKKGQLLVALKLDTTADGEQS